MSRWQPRHEREETGAILEPPPAQARRSACPALSNGAPIDPAKDASSWQATQLLPAWAS